VLIGLIAGVIVVFSVILLDKWKLDDPVGAVSVHLVCGIWGTLAVGIFGDFSFVTQLIGVLAYGAAAFPAALVIFFILKLIIGIRVSESEERRGLDLSEHNMEAYPDYQVLTYR
jgi:Amt family ammonium transporter